MSIIKNNIFGATLLCASFLSACVQPKVQQQEQKEELCGNDKDKHGCIASAGYTWSEVQKNCIRLFESGTRVEEVDGKSSAFIVFSPDSMQVELFFSDGTPTEILDRRTLPDGGYVWNIEDDDTKNVRLTNTIWTISQREKEIYRQEKAQD